MIIGFFLIFIIGLITLIIGLETDRGGLFEFGIVLLILSMALIFGLLIWILIRAYQENIKQEKENTSLYDKYLIENNFFVDRKILILDTSKFLSNSPNSGFYIDKAKQMWTYRKNNAIISDFHSFKDILSFELYEDGESIISGTAGTALAGGLLFGLGGAIVGGAASRTSSNTCTNMNIHIKLNIFEKPQEVISLITTTILKNTPTYREQLAIAKEICASLEYIMNDCKIAETKKGLSVSKNETSDYVEEIKKYKQLLEANIITQEEFNEKKKELLNL